jgi:hypothetical protein
MKTKNCGIVEIPTRANKSGGRNQQLLARRAIPPGWIIVDAGIAHVHAIDDGISKRPAALDDPPTHGPDVVIHPRACQRGW